MFTKGHEIDSRNNSKPRRKSRLRSVLHSTNIYVELKLPFDEENCG